MSTMFPQSIETAAVKDYLLSLINPLDLSNTASDYTNVTLNGTSGLAVFTQPIANHNSLNLTINNSFITSLSYVECILNYTGQGNPAISYYNTASGMITIHVSNDDNLDTDGQLKISFRIIA